MRTRRQLRSRIANGRAPLEVGSSSRIDFLNSDMLDGYHASIIALPNRVVVGDESALIGTDWLGTGTADATTVLRGDRTWSGVTVSDSIVCSMLLAGC